jgi:hypothetical protein
LGNVTTPPPGFHFFDASVKHDEVMDDFEEAGFVAQQTEMTVQRAIEGSVARFFPLQVILLWGFDGAVVVSFLPITEVTIPQLFFKQLDDPILANPLDLSDS